MNQRIKESGSSEEESNDESKNPRKGSGRKIILPRPEKCSDCGATKTYQWHCKGFKGEELCHSCFQKYKYHAVKYMLTGIKSSPGEPPARLPDPEKCSACGTTETNIWQLKRSTGHELCNRCYFKLYSKKGRSPKPKVEVKKCGICQTTKATTWKLSLCSKCYDKERNKVTDASFCLSKPLTIGWRDCTTSAPPANVPISIKWRASPPVADLPIKKEIAAISDSQSKPLTIDWRACTTSVRPANLPIKKEIDTASASPRASTTSASLANLSIKKEIDTTSASPLNPPSTTSAPPANLPIKQEIVTTYASLWNPPSIRRRARTIKRRVRTPSALPANLPLKKEIATTSAPLLERKITTSTPSPSNPPAKKLGLACSSSLNPPLTKKVRLSPGDPHSLEFSNEYIRYRDNLFNIMPQKPQFKPLQKYSSSFCNGMKLVLDLEFTNLAQRLSESADPSEFVDKIDEYNSRLATLEEMGYDVVTLRGQFDYLVGMSKNLRKKVRWSPGDSYALEFSGEFFSYRDNLFDIMPQNPQFEPLQKYSSSFRNGMKLVLDLDLTNVAQRLSESVDPIEFVDKIDGYISRLTTLEEMGYDVVTLITSIDEEFDDDQFC